VHQHSELPLRQVEAEEQEGLPGVAETAGELLWQRRVFGDDRNEEIKAVIFRQNHR
jgi:hypothetical protein